MGTTQIFEFAIVSLWGIVFRGRWCVLISVNTHLLNLSGQSFKVSPVLVCLQNISYWTCTKFQMLIIKYLFQTLFDLNWPNLCTLSDMAQRLDVFVSVRASEGSDQNFIPYSEGKKVLNHRLGILVLASSSSRTEDSKFVSSCCPHPRALMRTDWIVLVLVLIDIFTTLSSSSSSSSEV